MVSDPSSNKCTRTQAETRERCQKGWFHRRRGDPRGLRCVSRSYWVTRPRNRPWPGAKPKVVQNVKEGQIWSDGYSKLSTPLRFGAYFILAELTHVGCTSFVPVKHNKIMMFLKTGSLDLASRSHL